MPNPHKELLSGLLRDVSRSFYLTLHLLPGQVRAQIGLAYLLARTTDTIADTELVPLEQRLQTLQDLRARIVGQQQTPLELGSLARQQGSPAERILLERCEESLSLLQALAPDDRQLVIEVLQTITSGQELDLRRFGGASASAIVALRTEDELDDYTFRVAGCVGDFWTKLCLAHLFPNAGLDKALLLANGVRFGKGLQLVNILRDLPADLRRGCCYLPAERLVSLPLTPADLLDPAKEPRLRPLYDEYLDRAEGHLFAGWAYTNALPRRAVRLRLACSWPILIGLETLQLLRIGHVLDPQQRIKVSRQRVRRLRLRSVLLYPWRRAWERQVAPNRKAVASKAALP
jgi:farnesyl-diphosphate farnesyltransferase